MREEASRISVRAESRSYSMVQIVALGRFLSTSENEIFGTTSVQLYFERRWTAEAQQSM